MLDEIFTTAIVSIDTDRCLNNRHVGAGCSRCIDACSVGAITLAGHVPALDIDTCVRCGACSAVCPTDAVDGSDAPERRLLDSCDRLSDGVVTLACAQHPDPRPVQPGTAVVQNARCLAALRHDQLITLTSGGSRRVHLDLSWCRHCPLARTADAIVATVDAAAAMLAARTGDPRPVITLGDLPTVWGCSDDDVTIDSGSTGTIIDSWRPAMTRRGLFRTLRARAESIVNEPLTVSPPVRRVRGPVAQRLPQHIPESRSRLLDQLARIEPPTGRESTIGHEPWLIPAALLPLAEVHVDADSCSGCGLCARYCPTGALAFSTVNEQPLGGDQFELSFRMAICIGCDICAHACPETAVTFAADVQLADDLTRRHTVARGGLGACDRCGLSTATRGDAPTRCFSCRHGNGIVTALRDDAGLMADLLSRAPAQPAWAPERTEPGP